MWPDNRLRALFGIDIPIVQAPMAGSSGLAMARAVAEAGGLGSLACAPLDAEGLHNLLVETQKGTGKPINVNFFTHPQPFVADGTDAAWLKRLAPYYKALGGRAPTELSPGVIAPFDETRCRVIEALRPAVVSFHFGLPEQSLVDRIRAVGTKLISSATTVAEACWLVDHGCDAIIAQGYEAGGHRGMFLSEDITTQIGTMALVPQVVDAVDVPVIAAGGIADGRGIAAAFALGACGVQIGTAYLFTEEATVPEIYHATLREAEAGHSALSNMFSGRPARCIVNEGMRKLGPMGNDRPAFPNGLSAISPLRKVAEEQGRRDFSAHYCGQAVGLGYATTARQLTLDLAADSLRRIGVT